MRAFVKKIDSSIEELVTLVIDGVEVTCFAGVCPYEICVGQKYPVSFEVNVFDDYAVKELDKQDTSIMKVDEGFAYVLNGLLQGNTVICGIPFEDEILLSDFAYLDGKYVSFQVDRIDVAFL